MPRPCPKGWEYRDHPSANAVLPARCKALLLKLRRNALVAAQIGRDCRPTHLELFQGLTPPGFDYFAGHYRGENIRCLRSYNVQIETDPRVGARSDLVLQQLAEFRKLFFRAMASLDGGNALTDAQLPRAQKLYFTVAVAAWTLCEFFTLHPYANGNGHIGRFYVWAILGRYGYWPQRWPLDARPPEPSYSNALMAYRDGRFDELEKFILNCL